MSCARYVNGKKWFYIRLQYALSVNNIMHIFQCSQEEALENIDVIEGVELTPEMISEVMEIVVKLQVKEPK